MLSFKYKPSNWSEAFKNKIEKFTNVDEINSTLNPTEEDSENNIYKYKALKNVDKIFDLYKNDKSIILIKEKCNLDVEEIFKTIIPLFKKYVNKITSIKTEDEAIGFLNDDEYYKIIKIISENIIDIKKTKIKCIYKNGLNNADDVTKKNIINNAVDFNFTFTNNNLDIIEKSVDKYSSILVTMIKWMIDSLIEVYTKSGYDKGKLELILKLKDMLLYSFIDHEFILQQSNKSCDPKINKIKTAMIEQNDINMKKYISDMKESCKDQCAKKIINEKTNKISDSSKKCEEEKEIIREEIEKKNNVLKDKIIKIKEETTKISNVSNRFHMITIFFSILFLIFFYLYYKKK